MRGKMRRQHKSSPAVLNVGSLSLPPHEKPSRISRCLPGDGLSFSHARSKVKLQRRERRSRRCPSKYTSYFQSELEKSSYGWSSVGRPSGAVLGARSVRRTESLRHGRRGVPQDESRSLSFCKAAIAFTNRPGEAPLLITCRTPCFLAPSLASRDRS